MPTGLTESAARGEDARPTDETFFDRFGEPAIGTPGVTDRREAALQHSLEHLCRLQGQQGDRPVGQARECRVDRKDMDMRVDQPRNKNPACKS